MKSLFIIVLLVTATVSAQTSNRQIVNSMYKTLNEMCRGGSGDDPATNQACEIRTAVGRLQKSINSAKSKSNASTAIKIYKDLNEMCRGNSGDLPSTQQACELRMSADKLLQNMGYTLRKGIWSKK